MTEGIGLKEKQEEEGRSVSGNAYHVMLHGFWMRL